MNTTNFTYIRFILISDNGEEKYLTGFPSNAPAEFLKMYYFCKEKEIDLAPNLFSEEESQNIVYIIETIEVTLGGNSDFVPSVNIYVKEGAR